jgi:hypothetical protein
MFEDSVTQTPKRSPMATIIMLIVWPIIGGLGGGGVLGVLAGLAVEVFNLYDNEGSGGVLMIFAALLGVAIGALVALYMAIVELYPDKSSN